MENYRYLLILLEGAEHTISLLCSVVSLSFCAELCVKYLKLLSTSLPLSRYLIAYFLSAVYVCFGPYS